MQTPPPKKGYDPIRTPSFFTLCCREVKNGAMDDSARLDRVSARGETSEYNFILGENLMSKWLLVRWREREKGCQFLKHLPEEHGNTGKDAEFSFESNHGLFDSVRSKDWYSGKKSSQSKYPEKRKGFQPCWGIKPSGVGRRFVPYSGAKPRRGSCLFRTSCGGFRRDILSLARMPLPKIRR